MITPIMNKTIKSLEEYTPVIPKDVKDFITSSSILPKLSMDIPSKHEYVNPAKIIEYKKPPVAKVTEPKIDFYF